jgi:hypothetical protein
MARCIKKITCLELPPAPASAQTEVIFNTSVPLTILTYMANNVATTSWTVCTTLLRTCLPTSCTCGNAG